MVVERPTRRRPGRAASGRLERRVAGAGTTTPVLGGVVRRCGVPSAVGHPAAHSAATSRRKSGKRCAPPWTAGRAAAYGSARPARTSSCRRSADPPRCRAYWPSAPEPGWMPPNTTWSASVIALAGIALDQSRTIENARHHLRAGLLQLVLSDSFAVAQETAEQLGWRLPPSPVRVCSLATARPGRSLIAELEQYAERHAGRLFFADHRERIVIIVCEADLADVRRILHRNRVAAGCSTPVEWSDLSVGLREARRAAGRSGSERPFVQFEELVSEGMLALLEASGGPAVARRILQPLQARPPAERRCSSSQPPRGWRTTGRGIGRPSNSASTGIPCATGSPCSSRCSASTWNASAIAPSCGPPFSWTSRRPILRRAEMIAPPRVWA